MGSAFHQKAERAVSQCPTIPSAAVTSRQGLPSTMQTVTLVSAFVLVAVVLLTAPQTADAVCCYSIQGICGDCTAPTPYCGYRPCNAFGCNCGGGCRVGRCSHNRSFRGKDGVQELHNAESIIRAGDLNGDSRLSVQEAVALLRRGPLAERSLNAKNLDKNLDGFLTADEIDNHHVDME